ncbi:MAG: histidine kinase N-terminal 7TM domain-containing protein [Haloferacaceae archaeon]
MSLSVPLLPVLPAAVTVGFTSALLTWRKRDQPGALSLLLLLGGQVWWTTSLLFQIQATTHDAKLFWVNVSWVGVVAIPVAWLLFAFEYTGRDQYVQPRYVALISVIPAATVFLAFTNDFHQLVYAQTMLVEHEGAVRFNHVSGPWFWAIAIYTYVLGLLGSVQLLELVWSETTAFRGQSLALLVGTLVPWLSNLLYLTSTSQLGGIDPTPIAFAISGTAYLAALSRFQLFGTNPSPNRRAPDLLFEEMNQGAVVVDSNDHVVNMNEEAAQKLGVTQPDALGQPADEVIPDYETLPMDGSMSGFLTVETDNGIGRYDVTVSPITNAYDRLIGRVISLHDVTDYLRQQQRLEVLNRVLRHNIRTETNVISGYAGLLTDEHDSKEARVIQRRADRLEQIGEKGREILELFETDVGGGPLAVAEVLDDCLADVEETHAHVEFEVDAPDEDVYVPDVLEVVCENLIENAAEHNVNDEPRVWIDVESDGEKVRVTVADNGPGIDEYEREVLERGTETPLEHGSGLGLWIVKWGTELAGGTVEFAENDPTGTIVTVEVPRRESPNAGESPLGIPLGAANRNVPSEASSAAARFGSSIAGSNRSTRSRNP